MGTRETGSVDAAAFRWPDTAAEAWSAIPRTTLLGYIAPRLKAIGSDPVVIFDDGVELSGDALSDAAERLAGGLARWLQPGDRVALAVGNRAEFLIAYLAIVANRAVAVTLSPSLGPQDAAYLLGDSRPAVVIADEEATAVLEAATTDSSGIRAILRIDGQEPHGLSAHYDDDDRRPLDLVVASVDEITDIGYTSGTTGMPKALPGRHDELLQYADVFLRTCPMSTEDRILCPLKFYYGDPLWMLLASLEHQTPLIVMRRFSVRRFWAAARDLGATIIVTIGSIPNLLLTAPPSPDDREHQVRLAVAVGVPKDQHAELLDRYGIPWLEYYGSSEAGLAIAMPAHLADHYVGTGALGLPVPGIEARLVDASGVALEGPAEGELELRGATLFQGYLGDDAATAEVLNGTWLRSGDLMSRDADGVYYFRGRRKELIRRGGENIAPAEVEAVLRLHPTVRDAAVVPVPDALRGEEVKAYVELRPDAEFDPEELVQFCSERLSSFKVPRFLELRAEPFPRTPSERIQKSELMVDGRHAIETAWDREASHGR